MKPNRYWQKRVFDEQNKLYDSNEAIIEFQLKKYYQTAMRRIILEFEAVYNEYLAKPNHTPNMLYTMTRYYQMQQNLYRELQYLGDRELESMNKGFTKQYKQVYNSIKLDKTFDGIPATEGAKAALKTIWCSDGKHFSERIWNNKTLLMTTLNEGLSTIAITGKGTKELTKQLMNEFDVSYNRASAIVRTELAHVQSEAARDRYEGYGIKEYQVMITEDERTCPICSAMEGKKQPIEDVPPVPLHPFAVAVQYLQWIFKGLYSI